MKNLILILLLFFVATVCSAQVELEANKKGEYRVKEDAQEYATSSITAEPEAIRYIESFSKAIYNPNSFIVIEKSKKTIKMTGLFKALKDFKEKGILFNSDENKIVFLEKKEEREEKSFILIFVIISIILMIILNMMFKKDIGVAAAITAFGAAAAFAAAAITAGVAFIAALIGVGAALTLVFALAKNNHKKYKIAVIIYYTSMALYFIFMFLKKMI